MIRLVKGPIPDVLRRLGAAWTDAILDKLAAGQLPTKAEKQRYRHTEIRTALVAETRGKCAYCESKVSHIAHGDIEHITPKSLAPQKSFEWANLTLACDICNENKGDFDGNHENFVDPYTMEPTLHLYFAGPLLLPVPGSDQGLVTESVLELNRPDLFERRKERLERLNLLFQTLARTANEDARSVISEDIRRNETEASQEFAGLARQFVPLAFAQIEGP